MEGFILFRSEWVRAGRDLWRADSPAPRWSSPITHGCVSWLSTPVFLFLPTLELLRTQIPFGLTSGGVSGLCHPGHSFHFTESWSWADLTFTFFFLEMVQDGNSFWGTSTHPGFFFFNLEKELLEKLDYKASSHPYCPKYLLISDRDSHKYTH